MNELTERSIVYGLYCGCEKCKPEETIRYVGITVRTGRERLAEHVKPGRSKMGYPVGRWIAKHGAKNIRMKVLEKNVPPYQLAEREEYWVAKLRTFTDWKAGGLNRTKGGRSIPSDQVRERIRKANSRDDTAWSKMSREKAAELRELYRQGVGTWDLSQWFGISQGHVISIARNKTWRDPSYVYRERKEPVTRSKDPENPSRALSREAAREMRTLYHGEGATYAELIQEFGVSYTTVRNVLFNRVWIDPEYEHRKRPQTDRQRKNISRALKGAKKPEGHGEKVSRAVRGERHGMSKLTEAEVREIKRRLKAGERNADIAADYGVMPNQISRIKSGARWASVKE